MKTRSVPDTIVVAFFPGCGQFFAMRYASMILRGFGLCLLAFAIFAAPAAAASFEKEDRETPPLLLGSKSLLADVPDAFAKNYRKTVLSGELLERFSPPKLITAAKPAYPDEKRGSGETGFAQIEFVIDERGDFGVIVRIQATDSAFAVAAYEALLQFEFEPARLEDSPVALISSQRFNFEE